MEIKKIEKNVADYPKTNEISKEDIKKNIPKKFLKFGVALMFIQNFSNKVDASIIRSIDAPLAGVMAYIHPMFTVSMNIELVSLGIFALSLISIGITKIINKVKKIDKQVPKVLKILAIVSGVVSIISAIGIAVFWN